MDDKEETIVVSVRLPREVAERLAAEADELSRPRSWLVAQAIGCYLDGRAARRVDWTATDDRGACGWSFLAQMHFNLPGDADAVADDLVGDLRAALEAAGAREVWTDLQGIRPLALHTTIRSYMPQVLHATPEVLNDIRVMNTPDGAQVTQTKLEGTNIFACPHAEWVSSEARQDCPECRARRDNP